MTKQQQVSVATVESIRGTLVRHLQQLIDRSLALTAGDDALLDAVALLNGLPLSTSEFAVAMNRLRNAHRYLTANEPGAARYELRLLMCSVRPEADSQPIRRTLRSSRVIGTGETL